MEALDAGEAGGHHRGAMVAAPSGDDLLLVGAPEHVVVVPGDLDLGLVGVGTGQPVVDPRHMRRRETQNAIRELDERLVAVAAVGMEVGHLPGLPVDRLGDLGASVSDIDAIERGKAVDQLAALAIANADAAAGVHDLRRVRPARVLLEIGQRVHHALAVEFLQAEVVGGRDGQRRSFHERSGMQRRGARASVPTPSVSTPQGLCPNALRALFNLAKAAPPPNTWPRRVRRRRGAGPGCTRPAPCACPRWRGS